MKLYKSPDLKIEIFNILDFGIVDVGQEKDIVIYVKNDNGTLVTDLKFFVNNKEIAILSAPTELKKDEVDKIILKWKPTLEVKVGLKAELNISGSEIWD